MTLSCTSFVSGRTRKKSWIHRLAPNGRRLRSGRAENRLGYDGNRCDRRDIVLSSPVVACTRLITTVRSDENGWESRRADETPPRGVTRRPGMLAREVVLAFRTRFSAQHVCVRMIDSRDDLFIIVRYEKSITSDDGPVYYIISSSYAYNT